MSGPEPAPDGGGEQPAVTDNRSILILYGTETGHSQEIAEELGQVAERLRFLAMVEEMNEVKLVDLFRYTLVIFVTSTTGQGDMPRNTTTLWKSLLRKKLAPGCLSRLNFTTFGLGDSSYPKFNWAARKLQKRLLQLGATEFYPSGEGDERHDDGIDSIYVPWLEGMRAHLLTHYPLPSSLQPVPDDALLPPKYPLKLLPSAMETARHRLDGLTGEALEKEKAALFREFRYKNAALSHVEHPRSAEYQAQENLARITLPGHPFVEMLARRDKERDSTPKQHRVNVLDRDNVLTDHPGKYLLYGARESMPPLPPADLLPIPKAWVVKLVQNKRVTPEEHWQDVRELKLEATLAGDGKEPELLPGATVTIYPKNYPEDVQTLIDLMEWGDVADKVIDWDPMDTFVNPPGPGDAKLRSIRNWPLRLYHVPDATLRDLLTHNLDITSVPNRAFLDSLIKFTKDAREIERLKELTGFRSMEEFYDYTSRPRRTILEILEDFGNVRIPVDYALELFPLIRGREFSIANGGTELMPFKAAEAARAARAAQAAKVKAAVAAAAEDGVVPIIHQAAARDKAKPGPRVVTVDLLVALVQYKTVIRKPRQGLCSRYVKWLAPGTELAITVKTGNPPPCDRASADRPLLAIATGTGIAPIRSLIHERAMHRPLPAAGGAEAHGPRRAPELLFFGCRDRRADFYYQDEWARRGVYVVPAFSREPIPPPPQTVIQGRWAFRAPPPPGEPPRGLGYDSGKNYVQHFIRRDFRRVCAVLQRNGIVVLCGNSGRMPASVRAALVDAIVEGKLAPDQEQADTYLKKVTFWQETW